MPLYPRTSRRASDLIWLVKVIPYLYEFAFTHELKVSFFSAMSKFLLHQSQHSDDWYRTAYPQ